MVSLGRVTFGLGPPQSSDCKTLSGQGAPMALWCLGHFLFQCPKGCVYGHPPSSAPFVHTGYTGPIQVPMGLMVCKDQIGPEKLVSPMLAFEWSKPLPSSGPFAYFSGCVQSFQPYPYYWKTTRPIGRNRSSGVWGSAVVFWILCLMSGAQWAMKFIAKSFCTSGRREPHVCGILTL